MEYVFPSCCRTSAAISTQFPALFHPASSNLNGYRTGRIRIEANSEKGRSIWHMALYDAFTSGKCRYTPVHCGIDYARRQHPARNFRPPFTANILVSGRSRQEPGPQCMRTGLVGKHELSKPEEGAQMILATKAEKGAANSVFRGRSTGRAFVKPDGTTGQFDSAWRPVRTQSPVRVMGSWNDSSVPPHPNTDHTIGYAWRSRPQVLCPYLSLRFPS
jgi:hypothetical protein